jgi:hypothetical protein
MATQSVGISPTPHMMAPPRRWSSMAESPQSRPMLPNHEACSSDVELVSATPKNAWKAMVAKSRTSRSGNGARYGTGSWPIIDSTNR